MFSLLARNAPKRSGRHGPNTVLHRLSIRPRPGAAISQSALEEFLRAWRLEDIELGDLHPLALVARYDLPVQLDFESIGLVEPLLFHSARRQVYGVGVALFGQRHYRVCPFVVTLAH